MDGPLLAAVASLPDDDFARPSGWAERLVRDLVRMRSWSARRRAPTAAVRAGLGDLAAQVLFTLG